MSAVFSGGPPLEILGAWQGGGITLLVSAGIVEEYSRVVDELERRYPLAAMRSIIGLIADRAETIEGGDVQGVKCDDPDDLKFVACATAGRADAVVSGDRHLLRLCAAHGIPVMTPRALLDRLKSD